VRGCEATGLPWYILGTDGLWRLDPARYRSALEGRTFRWGWSDCWNLVRDFYGADMPDFPRTKEDSARLYLEHYPRLGWHIVPRERLQFGDAILMAIQSHGEPNHAAVYVGDSQILHHLAGRLSRRENYDGGFQAATRLVLRRGA
jgi:cell wall-associated NlpC family hydrolase